MTTKVVHSEDPVEHWSDITDVQGKCVLDLGCGWIRNTFDSTPAYFIKRGASLVVGIDVSCGEIDDLKSLYPEHLFVCQGIETPQRLKELIQLYQPKVIKMDIEGFESMLNDLSAADFAVVDEVAIEYHNPACKEILERKLAEFGLEVFALNSFGWYITDINYMGILHAKRKA